MRHVHLLDPQLQGQGGHYLNHDAQLVRELRRRSIPVTLYGREGGTVECEGIRPEPIFTKDIFGETAKDPQVWAIENFNQLNQGFLQDLCRIDLEQFQADDLIYCPNIIQNQLYALATWLARIPAQRRPAVAVMLRYLNHAMDYVQARANKELIALYYRFGARALNGVQPRSLLCADTRELATAYQQITGLPVVELPNPMDVSDLLATAPARPIPERPVVIYQGHTSPLRGFQFIPEIIERCQKQQLNARFIIQVQNRELALKYQMGATLEKMHQWSNSSDVRFVEGPLSPADYFNLLEEADIVILPYSPNFYGHGSSGVFTEAASIGKVMVVCAGTVAARQGKEFNLGVVAAPHWDAASIAQSVTEALRDLPALRATALAGSGRFRAENCAQTLWDRLFSALQALPAGNSAIAA